MRNYLILLSKEISVRVRGEGFVKAGTRQSVFFEDTGRWASKQKTE
jgi:hypothetical protein